jgi:hypothetical protein
VLVEETILSVSKTHKRLLRSFHVCVTRDVFGYIYMHRKAAELFKSFDRTKETENHNFLELGLMNIAQKWTQREVQTYVQLEVIKNRGYFYS